MKLATTTLKSRPQRTHTSLFRAILLAVLLLPMTGRLAAGQTGSASSPASGADLATLTDQARAAGVPVVELNDLLVRGRTSGLSEDQLGRFVGTLTGLAQDGLPLKPMFDRMRQGLVKKAPPERIDFAITKLDRRLRESGQLVDAAFPDVNAGHSPMGLTADSPPTRVFEARRRLIDQTAFALDQGVPAAALTTTLTEFRVGATPFERLTSTRAPLLALTSLTAEGLPPDQGLAFVRELHAGGARGPAMEDLGFGVAQAIKHGADPMKMRKEIKSALDRGVPPGQILRDIHERGRDGHPTGPPPGMDPPGGRRDHGGPPPPDDPGRRGRRGSGGGGGTGGGTGGGGGGGGRGGL